MGLPMLHRLPLADKRCTNASLGRSMLCCDYCSADLRFAVTTQYGWLQIDLHCLLWDVLENHLILSTVTPVSCFCSLLSYCHFAFFLRYIGQRRHLHCVPELAPETYWRAGLKSFHSKFRGNWSIGHEQRKDFYSQLCA